MSRKEESGRLIDEGNYRTGDGEERRTRLKKACKSCCLCVLIVIIIILIVMGFKHFHSRHRGRENFTSPDCLSYKNVGSAINLTNLLKKNEKLCNDSGHPLYTANSPARIYIIKGLQNLTDKQACGLESILRLFPDKTIYLIDFNKREHVVCDRCSSPPNYLGLLLYLYKDRLELMFADEVEFFKNTPVQCLKNIDQNLEFFAMLVTAYNYGGFVATPDMVVTSRDYIDCFPEDTVVEPFAILASKRCDDFLLYMMRSFAVCESHYSANLEDLLSQTTALYAKQSPKTPPRRLGPKEVCTKVTEPCSFLKLKDFKDRDSKWVYDLSGFCKQVVQAYLGIKINKMEVEEETSIVKSKIIQNVDNKTCDIIKNLRTSSGWPNNLLKKF